MADAQGELRAQQDAAAAIERDLRAERPEAAPPTYGDFLARMLAARQRQAAAVARAGAALEAERSALAAARTQEKVLDTLRERRAAAERRDSLRREQARLEDAIRRG
jgi:flagellar export protein FliJ